jgi:alpha,alpha-trehalose phosphorylase
LKISQQSFIADKSNPWLLSHHQLSHLEQSVVETLFSVGNGTIGTRGTSGYSTIGTQPENEGTYLNGVYLREAIDYDESAYGFAQFNNKMLQVNNTKMIEISTEDELFEQVDCVEKTLNLQQACYQESLLLSTKSGNKIKLNIKRIVCQHQSDLMINHYTIEPVNYAGKLLIKSFIKNNNSTQQSAAQQNDKGDPRVGDLSTTHQLSLLDACSTNEFSYLLQQLNDPDSLLIVATSHHFEQAVSYHLNTKHYALSTDKAFLTDVFEVKLNEQVIEFTKYSVYQSSQHKPKNGQKLTDKQHPSELISQSQQKLRQAMKLGYANNLAKHNSLMAGFWLNSDVVIEGNEQHQLAIRLNMLHLNMSAGRDGQRNIAAKGLTGSGYDGHYFWDSEIYITPYFIYTQPEVAKALLTYRFNGLAKAKQRAREMNHPKGALFPWRTIGGEECSSYFPAGTAQYHINAAIAYAIRQYFRATDDWQFIWEKGAQLLIETARLWADLGHFNAEKNDQFCLDMVTGPDEYTALVNNNYYTNAMAKIHLSFTCELLLLLKTNDVKKYRNLIGQVNISSEEILLWSKIAEKMYLPHDDKRNISPQDDSFLAKKAWDFAHTPNDKYPLLLHFHPLVIYRHQVLKQADVVLANFLQDDEIELGLKQNNLAFYEPLTTHDSTLSACTHSIVYSEVGDQQAAFNYFNETVLTDLNNLHDNSQHGVHTAAMAGSWMCVTQGFAGFRLRNDHVSFQPKLPQQWQSLQFKLKCKGCQIAVRLLQDSVTYQLLSGESLKVKHFQQDFTLTHQQPCRQFSLVKVDSQEKQPSISGYIL